MDLYEYQGKQLFRRYRIPVSEGRAATTPEEARDAAQELGGQVVVKAQVLTGGRGKAGGVKLAEGPDEAHARASDILGLDIRGHVVRRLWIEAASDITREYYLSVAPVGPATNAPCVLASERASHSGRRTKFLQSSVDSPRWTRSWRKASRSATGRFARWRE